MRKTFILAFLIITLFVAQAQADPISMTDAWQYTNMSSISVSTLSLHSDSDARNMFGFTSSNTEPTNTVFNDSSPKGFWHAVEWTLTASMTLGSFNLVAAHDGTGPPYYRYQDYRGFGAFKLEYLDASNNWQLLYSASNIGTTAVLGDGQTHPVYGGGVTYTQEYYYELYATITPTTAQTWRASFQQFGPENYHASGPRILELDGYAYAEPNHDVPEPATMLLLGLGLAGLAGVRRFK
jgi:hypothetical protein